MNPFASATRRSPSCRFALLYEAAEGRVRTTGQLLLADPASDDVIPRLIDPTGAFHQKQGKNPRVETSPYVPGGSKLLRPCGVRLPSEISASLQTRRTLCLTKP